VPAHSLGATPTTIGRVASICCRMAFGTKDPRTRPEMEQDELSRAILDPDPPPHRQDGRDHSARFGEFRITSKAICRRRIEAWKLAHVRRQSDRESPKEGCALRTVGTSMS